MVLLPLQSIWAAAASACPHERVSAGEQAADQAHIQTHEHAGTATATDGASADTNSERGSASDSTCHGQGSAAVFADDLVALAPAAAGIVPSLYARSFADRFPESPLRPPVLQLA